MLRWFPVCFIVNSKSFHSLIFKLCIMIVHTLNMCLSFLCKFDKHFLIFRAVELRHFSSERLRGCLVCVICNSSSFHSFIIQTMIRKYHNHKLQTTPWQREEEPLNHHETPGRQIKQSNQLTLPHQDDCNTRMDIK